MTVYNTEHEQIYVNKKS